MIISDFGRIADGRHAGLYILKNSSGAEAAVTNYGAALVSLKIPDKNGSLIDVVLGYDDAAGYENGQSSFGGTVGRFANRIRNASFDLNGRTYELTANHGPNALHGGRDFYVHRLWETRIPFAEVSSKDIEAAYAVESIGDERVSFETGSRSADSVTFVLDSPDGDQGFPGDLHIEVTYTLTERDELHLDYRAYLEPQDSGRAADDLSAEQRPDTPATALNLTNHSYFNLNGHDSGTVLGHMLEIRSGSFTATDEWSLPTGELVKVGGTPMDFRQAKTIGRDIDMDYEALHYGGGYDHNYVLSLSCGPSEVREVAKLSGDRSGIAMTVLTDLPGVQLYTSNWLEETGKDGAVYSRRCAACLETQFWPDAVNHDDFPGGILRSGEEFRSRTTYRFTAK